MANYEICHSRKRYNKIVLDYGTTLKLLVMKNALLIVSLIVTICANSQDSWAVSLRPTLHFPTRKLLNKPVRIGNGIELTGAYTLSTRTEMYAGIMWNRFDTDEEYMEENTEFIQRGVLLGALFFFTFFEHQENPFYARAGLTVMDAETSSTISAQKIRTAVAVGNQVGLGMKIKSIGKWYLVPEICFGSSSHRYTNNGVDRFLTFGHVSITGAIQRKF